MADTGRHADHDRRMEPFADGIGFFSHVLGFLGIGRFKHAYFGEFGIIAVILFVLGRMHARVIGRYKDKAAIDMEISVGKKWIGRYVETDHFHSRKGPYTGNRSSDSRFHSCLFIRCPFGIDFFIFSCILQDFRARRARIGRSKGDTGFIQAPCQGFIT